MIHPPEEIVEKLTAFPHRAVASKQKTAILSYLKSLLDEHVQEQSFRTHKTYLVTISWLIFGLVVGLISSIYFSWIGTILTLFFTYASLTYFNWYASPVSLFPPQVESKNILAREPSEKKKRVLLMAHYDTAPISVLYTPKMVGNFRQSLIINQVLILISASLSIAYSLLEKNWLSYVLYALAGYFIIQWIVASVDFFRQGYSNGASDNATGVAAAITVFNQIKEVSLKNTSIDIVLTGAEEVGMIGAKAFYEKYKKELADTYVINFDTLGAGTLKVITETGSLTSIKYENVLSQQFRKIINKSSQFGHISTGAWHTADFDSVWFNRAGIPTITLAALDKNGRMPNIHRETDVLSNVDYSPMHDAISLAFEVIKSLDKE